ncbi:tetratricopeptide repeat protein [Nesterenkonia flava]|uniref:Tetratricopeptide repeat protein n=1 Tax=Nesterenkonia flava TaxID=469799 RepID=A0ABU1FTN3_9MICC|nr:tetratricopeptide repeat protein [Nesterenkonia flava]MDR5712004.1 tetratricopeptide repeat protein [Nesterenkonia flava]
MNQRSSSDRPQRGRPARDRNASERSPRGGSPRERAGKPAQRGGSEWDRSGRDSAPRGRPERNPRDLRRSNLEERGRSPEIDEDVTGKELDREAARQLGTLNDTNRKWVAKHLVMAGRLIDIEPKLAFEHALAASRRGGRLAVVREAVGLTAYAAGNYDEALRELRTYRRISGDHTHLPVQADCLRGLGKPEKAVELAEDAEAKKLTGAARAEMAMVVAGAHQDLGDPASAASALEIPELSLERAFSFSPRLYAAYAGVLEQLGRTEEARRWQAHVAVAERALGVGAFEEPEIMDFDDDEDGGEPLPKVKDVL